MSAFWEGEPPMVIGTVTTLEEEVVAVCFDFGAISMVKIFKKD